MRRLVENCKACRGFAQHLALPKPKHNPPTGSETTLFVSRSISEIEDRITGPAIDLACGYGRNALFLANLGLSVYCLDIDAACLSAVTRLDPERGSLHPLRVNLHGSEWQLPLSEFGIAICVHYFDSSLIERVTRLLRPGGFLLIETVGNHGRNYLELPESGLIRSQMESNYSMISYHERPAGPAGLNRVTVKVLADALFKSRKP